MDNKFKQGDEVFERVRPTQRLVISRYSEGIYYCKDKQTRIRKELVFLERDIKAAMML